MRRVWLAALACAIAVPSAGVAQRAPDLRKPAAKEWLTIGGDWGNSRYSTLAQINRNNIKTLKGAWVVHLGSGLGAKYSMEGTPIVKDGVMYFATGNDDVFALDGKTGEPAWKTQVARWQDGYTITAAPLYHNGILYSGISGGDRSARGFVFALDAKTGKEKWRFWTVPAPGEFGSDTWPKPDDPDPKRANAWKVGGAAVWQTPAIDPDLGLIYFST